jgi:N-methylhydantoinase B/oxoprolinase/acetone carboxylase alpha subunit
MDRTKTRAWGLFGGGEGMSASILIKRVGEDRFRRFSEAFGTTSDSKFTRIVVHAGDEIIINSAGGGGYGSPFERPREQVRQDVREGFVSAAMAHNLYGLPKDEL